MKVKVLVTLVLSFITFQCINSQILYICTTPGYSSYLATSYYTLPVSSTQVTTVSVYSQGYYTSSSFQGSLVVYAPSGYLITYSSTDFDSMSSSSDFVTFYGDTVGSTHLISYSGSFPMSTSTTVTSSSGTMKIVFTKNSNNYYTFIAGYIAATPLLVCGQPDFFFLKDSTQWVLRSQQSSSYWDSADCFLTLTAPPGYYIRFISSSFNTEINYDFASFYEGSSSSGSLIRQVSGLVSSFTVQSSSESMYITFKSDSSTISSGFAGTIQAISRFSSRSPSPTSPYVVPSMSVSSTPSFTPTMTLTPSETSSPTPSSSKTPTPTPSSSFTTTPTPTSSVTPTSTPTSSITPVSTPSSSVSPTVTSLASNSPSVSPTVSISPTVSTSAIAIKDISASSNSSSFMTERTLYISTLVLGILAGVIILSIFTLIRLWKKYRLEQETISVSPRITVFRTPNTENISSLQTSAENSHHSFYNGVRIQESAPPLSPAVYSRPPALNNFPISVSVTPTIPELTCRICYSGERNTILVPCGHLFCTACANRVTICPLDRQEISSRQHVYL